MFLIAPEMGVAEYLQNMTVGVADLVDRYLEYIAKIENLSPKTVLNRRHILVPFFRFLNVDVSEMTLQDVDRYFMHRATEVKQSSIGAERQALRSFFRYCQEYLEMDMQFRWEVVRRKKMKPGKVQTFNREQVGEVIGLCDELQDKLIIALLFETGIRIGELLSLLVTDIDGAQIRVRGKGEEDRVVFMPERLAEALDCYLRGKGHLSGHVFRPLQKHVNHSNDRYVSAYAVRDRIQRAFLRCGHKMHPHQLRHSFAVNWVEKGGDIRTLQLILGHASIETTQWYLRLSDRQTESIYRRVVTESVLNAQATP